jgi:hypothetical protein
VAGMQQDRFGSLIRQVTPLVLLGIAMVAMFGDWLPGAAWVQDQLGGTFLLRLCVALLTLYVLLLWGESMRLHAMLTSVLRELVAFRNQRAQEAQGRPLAQRLEAARLLLPALSSSNEELRQKSRKNLALLVGEDLGEDPARWQAWLAEQEASADSA